METVTVNAEALREVLDILTCRPPHMIMELRATIGLPGEENALETLVNEFNEQVRKFKEQNK